MNMKCEIGDIVLVNSYKYPDGTDGYYHNFVIAAIDEDELTLVHLDYFSFKFHLKLRRATI